MYSDGLSCMNIKFYNTSLSFQLYPYNGKDQNGRPIYNTQNGQQTTVNVEGAATLYTFAKDIIDGKIQEGMVTIPCLGASVSLERKLGQSGPETIFTIMKNNTSIPFRFTTIQAQVKDINGTVITKNIEAGLGAFAYTIFGYLDGVNAERHLNKLTEEYAKAQESNVNNINPPQPQQPPMQQNNTYRPQNNNYRKQYNNGGNNYRPKNNWNNNQRFDSYQVQQ